MFGLFKGRYRYGHMQEEGRRKFVGCRLVFQIRAKASKKG
jgi:hypothetical protein